MFASWPDDDVQVAILGRFLDESHVARVEPVVAAGDDTVFETWSPRRGIRRQFGIAGHFFRRQHTVIEPCRLQYARLPAVSSACGTYPGCGRRVRLRRRRPARLVSRRASPD